MQRGIRADADDAVPGIFQTIATAMSLLLLQPVLLAIPLLVDLVLWLAARFSPAALLEPLLAVLNAQRSPETAMALDALSQAEGQGNLLELVGWFVPTLVGTLGGQALAAPWPRDVITPSAAGSLGLLALILMVGAFGLMTFEVLLARTVRGGVAGGPGLGGQILTATLRYAGFMALLVPAVVLAVIGAGIVIGVLTLFSQELASIAVLALLVLLLAATLLLAFTVDAIALAEVGPIRAVELSIGVVRRYPWPALGLLLVSGISLFTLPEIGQHLISSSVAGVVIGMVCFAFIATGLALARMQFFADRLGQWQPGLVKSVP